MNGTGVSGFRPRFFAPVSALGGDQIVLSPEDSHHALKVLRLEVGDRCEVAVGAAVYAATVAATASPVRLQVVARLEGAAAGASYRLQVGLVQAMSRPAILDHVLEKGTEVGASFFLLVQTADHAYRLEPSRGNRMERWRRIVREAAKQSKQVAVPMVDIVSSVDEGLQYLAGNETRSLVLEPTARAGLYERLGEGASGPANLALWVGPESGWSEAESERFSLAGLESVRLGRSVLRTETAGPVAVAVARLALGDW